MEDSKRQEILIQRIVSLCNQKKMTHYKLSYESTVPLTTITNILNGKSQNPGIFTIMKLCDGLDISLNEFFDTKEFQDMMKCEKKETKVEK